MDELDTNSTELETSVWVGDLLFQRPNRSLLYGDSGQAIFADAFFTQISSCCTKWPTWEELRPRIVRNAGMIAAFCFAVLLNFLLLVLSCTRRRRSYRHKSNCLIAALAFANIVLSCGFLLYTLIIDVYYADVDSFDTLIQLHRNAPFGRVWVLVKEILHFGMVDGLLFTQTFLLLFLSVDRYCSLFPSYSPLVKRKWLVFFVCLLPFVCGVVGLNARLLRHVFSENTSKIIRLTAFLLPTFLSVVFAGCSVARNIQDAAISNPNHDLSCSLAQKSGLLLELLHSNFGLAIVVGSREGDQLVRNLLRVFYEIAHYLLLFFARLPIGDPSAWSPSSTGSD
ncbi:hypothetical protein M3Y99_00054800 [Aphelenchoides fujianensis]|nr:hypothetical protein M3Y99_00054800 [Aphelenchoides fujianensis]